jgi:hypothetical protein
MHAYSTQSSARDHSNAALLRVVHASEADVETSADDSRIVGDLSDRYARMLAVLNTPNADSSALRGLALHHPGALRELDRTSPAALHARHAAVLRAQVQPWMQMLATYTDYLRSELHARRVASERTRAVHGRRLTELAIAHTAATLGVDPNLVRESVLADARVGEPK